eukprot:scaffold26810_cov64-Phaeocystis_antarctica.AAC.4
MAAARLDVDELLERDLQLDDVPRGETAQVEQQVAVAAAHAGVEGEHKPVLDEQHQKAREQAEHLEHGLDISERLALDRPAVQARSHSQVRLGWRIGVGVGRAAHGASRGQHGSHAGEVGEPAVVAVVFVEALDAGARLGLERRHDRLDGGHLCRHVRSQVVQQGQRALGVRVEQRQVRGSSCWRRALGHCTAGALGLGGCPARREGARLLGERLLVLGVGVDVAAGQRRQLGFRGVEACLVLFAYKDDLTP